MIILMRHASTDANGLCIGRTAVPLNQMGIRQAACLPDMFGQIGVSRLCCSPAKRAMDTILPLSEKFGITVEILPALDEIDMGEWDGLSFKEIRQRFPAEYKKRGSAFGTYRPPGGESFSDVADRAVPVLEDIAIKDGLALIVTHAGVIRSVSCRLTGFSMDAVFHFKAQHLHCTFLSNSRNKLGLVGSNVAPDAIGSLL